MRFAKIACATDFSVGAAAALGAAAQLARAQNAELVISHAWSLPAAAYLEGYAFEPDVIDRATAEAQRGLDEASAVARAAGVTQVSTALLSGPAWRAITDAIAGDPKIDLIVVGTHGRSGGARLIFGSVATQVVRHARCSVLIVQPDHPPAPFDHILCPVDFSDSAWHAVELAVALARPGGRGITMLHVVEVSGAFVDAHATPRYLADVERRASAELEGWATKLRALTDVQVSTRTHEGSAGTAVLSALAEDPSLDLVITGSYGRHGLERVLLGSVAEKIVHHARTPVLVARRRAA